MLIKFCLKILGYLLEIMQSRIYSNFRSVYKLYDTFRFNGKDIIMYGDGDIEAGENSYVGEYSTWQAMKSFKIQISKDC